MRGRRLGRRNIQQKGGDCRIQHTAGVAYGVRIRADPGTLGTGLSAHSVPWQQQLGRWQSITHFPSSPFLFPFSPLLARSLAR